MKTANTKVGAIAEQLARHHGYKLHTLPRIVRQNLLWAAKEAQEMAIQVFRQMREVAEEQPQQDREEVSGYGTKHHTGDWGFTGGSMAAAA